VSPIINYAFAGFCLILVVAALLLYIGHDRLKRLAFLRKERLVRHCIIIYSAIYDKLLIIEKASTELTAIIAIEQRERGRRRSWMYRIIKRVLFVVLSILIVLFIEFFTVIYNLVSIFFKALIVWRGYKIVFHLPPFLSSVTKFIDQLSSLARFDYVTVVFYPFLVALDFIASLNINLSSVRISCSGAQAPIRLLFDCLIAGFVVVVVESDVAVFWFTSFASANFKFLSLVLNRHFLANNFGQVITYMPRVFFFGLLLPNPIKMIQYLLGNHMSIR